MMEVGRNHWGKMQRKKPSKIIEINQGNKASGGRSDFGENLIPCIEILRD
jgi:hypothetical protein